MEDKKKRELKERLFSKIFIAMISIEYCELPMDEVIKTTESAIGAFRHAYRLRQG